MSEPNDKISPSMRPMTHTMAVLQLLGAAIGAAGPALINAARLDGCTATESKQLTDALEAVAIGCVGLAETIITIGAPPDEARQLIAKVRALVYSHRN